MTRSDDRPDELDDAVEAAAEPVTLDGDGLGWWRWALAGVVLAAGIARFVHLGDRPMHHDESLDAWYSWKFARGQPYRYDPVYHGPLRFYLTAGIYQVFGESEATARTLSAACGTAIVALIGLTRRWLGAVGSLAAAALVAVSPSMLYFARFGREDTPTALLELGLLVLTMAWLRRPQRWHPAAAGALLAALFATKETSFITVAVMGSYLVGLGVADEVRRRRSAAEPADAAPDETDRPGLAASVWASVRGPGAAGWLLGLLAFAAIFSLLFSVFLTHPGGIVDGAVDGIRYWLSQQPVNRGGMRWPFYLLLIAGYEWPIAILGLLGLAAIVRARDRVLGLVAWTAFGNLAVYSWASERFPWLVVHPLLPLILLAGVAVQRIWDRRDAAASWGLTPYVAGASLVFVALLTNSARVVYAEPSRPRQMLSAVQTSDDVPAIRDEIERVLAAVPAGTAPPRILIDVTDGASWPWAWYLRDKPSVAYVDLAANPRAADGVEIVLASKRNVPGLISPVGGWVARPYAHRVWWAPPWDQASASDWFGWIANRRTFGPTGALDSVYLEKVGIPGGSSTGTSPTG